ncbi:N-formylglutamate amidohydrolase [Thioclava sp. SK-1]|uniref:N-formylglutamate amidohydrolase n=1 Tax=Thioclava sp. SK-1 TaxID=1889770 RepID=UPI000825A2D3|nr:N-formylglutamate amidohydrolase [Thioclava sp. SK-1]OCX66280.1 N-formylglutamate amidohydrolase [Thioclava sp. SK-1]
MTQPVFSIESEDAPSRWLVTVDHATNHVPDWVNGGDLGICASDMARHIAYDVGALGLSRALAGQLHAPMVASNFSRLVIDPNRGEDDPTLVMKLYDGTVIPANRHAGPAQRTQRLNRLHRPYHDALEQIASARDDRVICAVHSFTPQLRGRAPRPWQVGILSDPRDRRLADPLIALLRADGICTGDNEPYIGHLDGDSIDRHALQKSLPNVLIELRSDLVETASGQAQWAARIAPLLTRALDNAGV